MSDNSPPERDVRDFEFIQLCKFRVTSSDKDISANRGKLLACSSQFGLLVYATAQGFSVVRTVDLLAIDRSKGKERSKVVVEDIPVLASISLCSPVQYMDVSCDGLFLAVVVQDLGHMCILFFDVRSFAEKGTDPIPFACSQVNASHSAEVWDLSWNPAVPNMLAVCTSDGNVELIDVTDTPKVIAVLVAAVGATCFCWSPKGKQLLVGRKDGTLAQYDHGLLEKKIWPCPDILNGPHRVVDVVWQSTYVFMAAYLPLQAQPSDQPLVIMSSANKDKITHINFEDVCFGNGEERKAQYFFHFIQKWDVILMASSNATETTIVGRNLDDKISWEHWNLEDCSRADLPLTSQQSDSFPMGLAVDYSPHNNVVLSESKTLPPCPVMYLLSTDGMLVAYHLFYSHKEAAPATTPALPLTAEGARRGGPELASVVSSGAKRPLLPTPQPTQSTATTAPATTPAAPSSLPPVPTTISASASLSSTPASASLPSTPASTAKVSVPSAASTPASFSFPAASASLSTPRFPFAASPAPPVFPFGAGGSTQGTATSGAASQRQMSDSITTASSQSGHMPFAFGGQLGGPTGFSFSSAAGTASFPFGGAGPVSTPTNQPGPPKPFVQNQSSLGFGSAPPAPSQAHNVFASAVTSTPALFGHTQAPLSTKNEAAPKTSPQITSAGTLSSGISGASQLRPVAPAAFPARPIAGSPDQAAQFGQSHGNGLVGGHTVKVPHQPPQPSVTPAPVSVTSQADSKSIEATVDSDFTQNILEEMMDFEKELAELRARVRREVRTVGTREEMQTLRQDKEKMVNFTQEIHKVTKDQLREVQEQKDVCFNLLAMSEECQSRAKRDLDPHYHSLLLGRLLDPASSERLKALQQMSQAIEQSVLEVDHTLDGQWQEHLAKKKQEKRFYTPAGETIYKSIRNNHIVISSQRQQLDKLEEQLRNLKLYHKLSGRDYASVTTLNGDATTPLKTELKPNVTLNASVANGMTPEKVAKLRDILSQRKVPKVKSTAPANLSMSRIVRTTPGRSPATATNTPPHQQQQQQTPQRPQQQRKHQLPHQAVPSPVYMQMATPTAMMQASPHQLPNKLHHGSTPAKPPSSMDVVQRPVSSAPTSFSGVGFFKQPQADTVAFSKLSAGPGMMPSPLSASKSGIGVMPGAPGAGVNTPVTSTPGAKLAMPPLGQGFALPAHQRSVPTTPSASISLPQSLTQQSEFYENVTPIETEEEEDDDYEEEDNGYDDEEEEEDEEETGFEGIAQGAMSAAQLAHTFGIQAKGFGSLSSGGASGVGSGAAATASAGAGNLFKFSQGNSTSTQAFTPLKTTAQTLVSAAGTKPGLAPTSMTLASKDLFGAKTSSTGAVFGGPATFGEKPGMQLSSGGRLFGSQVTPSKMVGFCDLSEKVSPGAGKENVPEEKVTVASVNTHKEVTTHSPSSATSSATTSPSAAAVSSAASAFSFVQAAAGAEAPAVGGTPSAAPSIFGGKSPSTTASVFGGKSPSTTASVFGGKSPSATTSVFGGKSPSEGSKFGFAMTPASSATTGFQLDSGANAQTAASASVFGAQVSSTAASASPHAPPASTQTGTKPEKTVIKTDTTHIPGMGGSAAGTAAEASLVKDITSKNASQGVNPTSSSPSSTAPVLANTSTFNETLKTVVSSASRGATPEATTAALGSSAATEAASVPPVFGGMASAAGAAAQGTTSTTTAGSLFGISSATTGSVFGEGSATTAPQSVFGGTTTTAGASVFDGASATTTASPSIFGGGSAATASSSVFGGSPAKTTSLFGGSSTPTSTPSLFGISSATTSTPSSLFGGSSTTTSTLFGGSAATTPSLFGSSAATTSPSVFGMTSTTTASSVFGGGSSTTGSVFGGITTTTASSPFSSAGSSVFGNASTTKSATLFSGTTPATTPAFGFGGVMNSAASSGTGAFGGGSVFGATNTAADSSSTGLFGAGSSSTSVFSSNMPASQSGSVFGQTTPSMAFGFGQSSNTGGSSVFGQSAAFGQQPSGTSSSGQSGGLFGFGGLGGKPSEEKAKLNVFGSPQVFGSTTNQATNLFGSGGSNTFGGIGTTPSSPSTAAFGTGGFSSGAGGVASSGFGVTASQQTSGGFGAAPSFGSAPTFGGSSIFGSKLGGFGTSPSFGAGPSFGASPTFSNPAGASATGGGFSSFASAPAPTFGQLAQSSPTASGFGGGGGFASSSQTPSSPFGGGFGSSQPSFGAANGGSVFGQAASSPGFGGQTQGFGAAPTFGSNPAFSSYRG
ncbi:hypothetical protein BsWGS_08728 [Bradybaena similaris]